MDEVEKKIRRFLRTNKVVLTSDKKLYNKITADITSVFKKYIFSSAICFIYINLYNKTLDQENKDFVETLNLHQSGFWLDQIFRIASYYSTFVYEQKKEEKKVKSRDFKSFCLHHLDNILFLLQCDEDDIENQLEAIEKEVLTIRKQITTGSVVYGSKVDK